MERPKRPPLKVMARRLGIAVIAAFVLAMLLTLLDTGELFSGETWSDAFWFTAVVIGMMGITIALQTAGLLIGIVAAIVFSFIAIVAFEGKMGEVFWIGEFFLKALKMIIVPLIIFAMVSGITAMGDVRKLGRLGGRTVGYYAATTLIAVVIGTVLVNIIQPGVGTELQAKEIMDTRVAAQADRSMTELIFNFVSDNIFYSLSGSERDGAFTASPQMLPIIVFALLFGAVITTLGDKGKAVIAFFDGGNEAMMKIVHILMLLAPIGIFGLVAGRFGEAVAAEGMDAFLSTMGDLAAYMATVLAGLGIHALVVLPLILKLTTGRSPLQYAKGMAKALLTAFSTASSAATMPITLESVEQENKVDPRASQFVIPLGATVNMDGTALYEAVAAIFIAQFYGIELGLGEQILVVLTATLAAIGAAGIPEAGLFTMVIVLQAVGLPLEGTGLILAVDWLLDRFRTTVNVWGDAVGAGVMEKHGMSPPDPGEEAAVATS